MPARYEGQPQVQLLSDGRNIKLLADFIFYDPEETRWAVPAEAVVDGASIPKLFWSIIGGPFDGIYRDASIIHDWYCDKRTRTWQATHLVFYEAMRVSGVSDIKAKVMYFAVRWKGPRWDKRVIFNTNLSAGTFYNLAGPTSTTYAYPLIAPGDNFDEITQTKIFTESRFKIEEGDYSIAEIDNLADLLKPDSSKELIADKTGNIPPPEINFFLTENLKYFQRKLPSSRNEDIVRLLVRFCRGTHPYISINDINDFLQNHALPAVHYDC